MTMTADDPFDPAVESLRATVNAMRSVVPIPTRKLKQKLVKVMGMMPNFPDHFTYVYNFSEGRVVHAQGFQQVLGHPDEAVDMDLLYRLWHPEDAPILARLDEAAFRAMALVRYPSSIFDLWLSVDYRVRKNDGTYLRILRQTAVFEVDEASGQVISTFSLCKDISMIKSSNSIGWHIRGVNGYGLDLSGLMDYRDRMHYRPSARELDVLRMLAEGKSSKMIAYELGISLHTVNAHRRNLLDRSGMHNTTELVRKLSELGWF